MGSPSRVLEEAYAEAYRLGDVIMSQLRVPPTDGALDEIGALLDRRDAQIQEAGNAARTTPRTDESLRILRGLLDQQQVLEREMARVLGQMRQTWQSNDSVRTKVDGAKRMLGFQGTSRQLNTKR